MIDIEPRPAHDVEKQFLQRFETIEALRSAKKA